jgi:DNA sulfur modification protein DndD
MDQSVSLDPNTYEASVIRQQKKVPFAELSEGEKQVVSMSLIGALAKLSQYKVPVVIDTPFGRLDKAHRVSLSQRFLKNVSHQIVILSTDEEIVGRYKQELQGTVGAYYTIERVEEGRDISTIEEGYFD